LADKATEYLHLLNSRQLRGFDDIISEDATCHVSADTLEYSGSTMNFSCLQY
jgi:hypothetical protein